MWQTLEKKYTPLLENERLIETIQWGTDYLSNVLIFFLFFEVFSPFTSYYLNIPRFIFLGVIKCNPHILHYFHIWQSDLGKNFVSGLLWKFWDPSLLRPFLGHNSAKKTLLSSPLLHLYLSFRGNLKYYFFKEDWIRIPIYVTHWFYYLKHTIILIKYICNQLLIISLPH